MIEENKVSIVMPTFNSADYILDSIKSVISQKHTNWELIIVDDCSTDNTFEKIRSIILSENRIKYFRMQKNTGAAHCRNYAINKSKGEFIAFLDSDDIWYQDKIYVQLKEMYEKKSLISCTGYEKINEQGQKLNKKITPPNYINYDDLLKNCPGNSTVMYNAKLLGKHYIPNIKKRNDYLMWLKIIKETNYILGIEETLGSHRIRKGSISSNKLSLIKYHWIIYTKIEKIGLIKSLSLMCHWTIYKPIKDRMIK